MQQRFLDLKAQIEGIQPRVPQLSDAFYRHLFKLEPEIEGVFRNDAQARLTKFTNMLATLANLKHFEKIRPALRSLGQRHASYGVKNHYYGLGKRALLGALAEVEGAEFTQERHDLWRDVLDPTIAALLEGTNEAMQALNGAELIRTESKDSASGIADLTLLDEIGGWAVIYDIHLAFYQELFEEPWLQRFFWGKHEDVLARKQTDFIVACMGGPNNFKGETPAISHMHMFITDEMLDVREVVLRRAMTDAGLSADIQERWLRIDNAFRPAIVKHSLDECVMRCVGQRPIVANKPDGYPD